MAVANAYARPGVDVDPTTDPAAALRGLSEDLVDLRRRLCAERGILPLDVDVLEALFDLREEGWRATPDELAVNAHTSIGGTKAALDRLQAAGLAQWRSKRPVGMAQRDYFAQLNGQEGGPLRSFEPIDGGPAPTDAGRELVATLTTALEAPLEAILGALPALERYRLGEVLEACRSAVWEVGAAPVVAVLED